MVENTFNLMLKKCHLKLPTYRSIVNPTGEKKRIGVDYSQAYRVGILPLSHILYTRKMHTKYWLKNMKGRNYLEDIGVDGRIESAKISRKRELRLWMRFI
jgi:hypothetical protein